MVGHFRRVQHAVSIIVLLQLTIETAAAGCGETSLEGDSGYVTTPNHPRLYPRNADCTWTITVDSGKKVVLTFDSFDVEYHDHCANDYVELEGNGGDIVIESSEGDNTGSYPGVDVIKKTQGKFCGTKPDNYTITSNYTSRTNIMVVKFKSDQWVAKTGFNASYVAVDKDEPTCAEHEKVCDDLLGCVTYAKICDGANDCEDGSDEKGCVCKEIPTELGICKDAIDYGTMVYPNLYGHENSSVLLQSPILARLRDLKSDSNPCHEDVFAFVCSMLAPKCENNEIKPPCRVWCPDVRAQCLPDLVPDICATLPFSEDCFINRAKGVQLTQDASASGCGGVLRQTHASFQSPNFGTDNYDYNRDCVWSIRVPAGLIPVITFHSFKLEGGPTDGNCPYDYVSIFDGEWPDGRFDSIKFHSSDSETPEKLCGEMTKAYVVRPKSYVVNVVFSSDGQTSNKGFNASYATEQRGDLTCQRGEELCSDEALCIPLSMYCNGKFDCWDKSDEENCQCNPLQGELEELCARRDGSNYVTFPNIIGHKTASQLQTSDDYSRLKRLATSDCHVDIGWFVCEMMAPTCDQSTGNRKALCRTWCEEIRSACEEEADWPEDFPSCNVIEGDDGNNCVQGSTAVNCYHGKGTNYRGTTTVTETGKNCTSWADHMYEMNMFGWANLQDNYCRNPGNVAERPWCYVIDQWEYCSVQPCSGKVCSNRGLPRNVKAYPLKEFYWPGDKVTYRCDTNYTLKGAAVIKCLDSSTWDNSLPTCIVDDHRQLLSDMFNVYSKEAPPSELPVDVTAVFSGQVVNIVSLDETGPEVQTEIILELRWIDNRLSWAPSSYGDTESVQVAYARVWAPTVILQRNADASFNSFPTGDVTITSGGEVIWLVQTLVKTTCDLDQYLFPFDKMTCPVCVKTDTKGEKLGCPLEGNMTAENNLNCSMSSETSTGEWSVTITADSANDTGCLTMALTRNPTYHMCTTIAPTIILAVLMTLTFLIPLDKGDRLGYGMAILLSMVVSLIFITDFLPRATHIPFVGTFVVVSMSFMTFFMLVTAAIIIMSGKQGDLPSWARGFFLRGMARCLLMGNLAKKSYELKKVNPSPTKIETVSYVNGSYTSFGDEEPKRGDAKATDEVEPVDELSQLRSITAGIRQSLDNLNVSIEALRQDKEEEEEEENEWMLLCYVLDRLCLILYVLAMIAAVPLSLYLGRP